MTGVLLKRGNLDTGRAPCEDEGRDPGEVSASSGMPMFSVKPQKPGRDQEGCLCCFQREHGPGNNTFTAGFSLQNGEMIHSCCLRLLVCGTWLQQFQETNAESVGDQQSQVGSRHSGPGAPQIECWERVCTDEARKGVKRNGQGKGCLLLDLGVC